MGLSRSTLEGVGRVYFSDSHDMYLPSVTTCLDQKETPRGLIKWKEYNDGTNGKPHWRDILNYKSYRGTMIHYKLLDPFADEDIGGHNEEEAEEELKKGTEYGSWQEYRADLFWAVDAFEQIKAEYGITHDSVLDVECFVQNTDVGYAGQFDLLYVDKEGDVVLADLKTSKSVYDKHKLQLSAYKHAVNIDIDKCQVIRLHPDSETWEVSSSDEWFEDLDELYEEFCDLRSKLNEDLEAIAQEGVDDA